MRALSLLALALLATALPAQAQAPHCAALPQACQTTVQVTIAPPVEPVPPLGGAVAVPVSIDYAYSPLPLTMAPTTIELRVTQAPPWLSASVAPSTVHAPVTVQPAGAAMQQAPTMRAFLLLSAGADAPAFTSGVVEVTATAHGNGGLAPSRSSTQVPVQAGYLGLLDVTAAARAIPLQRGDGQIVPLRVANLGNAATRVTFEVAQAPHGVEVFAPGDLTMDSPVNRGEEVSTTVFLGLNAPGAYRAGDVVLLVHPAYAVDPAWTGAPVRLVLHVGPSGGDDPRVQTLGAGSDAVEPWTWGLLAAGAAGVAMLERQRRRSR